MPGRLQDRVALVTGGGRSIGFHFARALAAEGARVAVADLTGAADAAAALGAEFGAERTIGLEVDVSDEAKVRAMVGGACSAFGRIDILVNNAAVFANLAPVPYHEIDVALWDRVHAVNVRGLFLVCKHVLPLMTAQRYGKVINIGSGTAVRGMPMMLHYVASKGAVMAITRCLAREVGEANVCVNTLSPGLILSESVQDNIEHHEHARAKVLSSRAIPREAAPADLIGALVFLASAESDFITGQTIAVDGGTINT